MKTRQNCLFCVALSAVLFGSLSVSVFAMTVPRAECPQSPYPAMQAPCHDTTWSCEREDSNIISVSSGTKEDVNGASESCINCKDGCPTPEPPLPSPMDCSLTLGVPYTETVTVTVAGGISAGIKGLGASLEASIGHASERTFSTELTCGTSSLPPCQKASYAATLGVWKNVQTKIDHSYKWKMSTSHDPSACTTPDLHTESYPVVSSGAAGTKTSTATGSSYGSASCRHIDTSYCP